MRLYRWVQFFHAESASGLLLALASVAAMVVANSPLAPFYFEGLQTVILGLTVQHWINDGLMALFFFVVGLEIKKELVEGELNTWQKALLPAAAAVGGMLVPALIYWALNPQSPMVRGWGIPMATDIAFALGVLAVLGSRIPRSLKIFLMALAIIDDLGAVSVIAIFYSGPLQWWALALAFSFLFLVWLLRTRGVASSVPYVLLGVAVWVCFLRSGVHATIAGVLLGLMTPAWFLSEGTFGRSFSPVSEWLGRLHVPVSFVVMPVFAFANAGISLSGVEFSGLLQNSIFQGVSLGLLLGKPVGILLFSLIVTGLGWAYLPSGVRWGHIFGASLLAGIGFTMSLFISGLALTPEFEVYSKTAILFGSLLAGLLGAAVLWSLPTRKAKIT